MALGRRAPTAAGVLAGGDASYEPAVLQAPSTSVLVRVAGVTVAAVPTLVPVLRLRALIFLASMTGRAAPTTDVGGCSVVGRVGRAPGTC